MKNVTLVAALLFCFCSTAYAQPLTLEHKPFSNDKLEVSGGNIELPVSISLAEVPRYVGKMVTVCGKVFDARLLTNVTGQPTLMNLGGANADERVEVRINFSDLARFNYNPAKLFLHKELCVTGKVTNEHGYNEILIDSQHARLLLYETMNQPDTTQANGRRIALISKAYLFAGPGLNEPIITHLKLGSIMAPVYSIRGWTYGQIIEMGGTGTQPKWMYGFIRNQALGVNGKLTLKSTVKQGRKVKATNEVTMRQAMRLKRESR